MPISSLDSKKTANNFAQFRCRGISVPFTDSKRNGGYPYKIVDNSPPPPFSRSKMNTPIVLNGNASHIPGYSP